MFVSFGILKHILSYLTRLSGLLWLRILQKYINFEKLTENILYISINIFFITSFRPLRPSAESSSHTHTPKISILQKGVSRADSFFDNLDCFESFWTVCHLSPPMCDDTDFRCGYMLQLRRLGIFMFQTIPRTLGWNTTRERVLYKRSCVLQPSFLQHLEQLPRSQGLEGILPAIGLQAGLGTPCLWSLQALPSLDKVSNFAEKNISETPFQNPFKIKCGNIPRDPEATQKLHKKQSKRLKRSKSFQK